jgi:hypothetical protein
MLKFLLPLFLAIASCAPAWGAYSPVGLTDTELRASAVPVTLSGSSAVDLNAGTNSIGTVGLNAGSNVIGALTANQSVNVAQVNGVTPLMGAGNTGTGSPRVTIASDQAAIPVKSGVNPNGSYAEITNLTTTAQTFTPPTNAVGFVIETPSDVTTVVVRYKIGATATTTSGMVLEPGRSESYNMAANISVIAVSGTSQAVTVQWILNQ